MLMKKYMMIEEATIEISGLPGTQIRLPDLPLRCSLVLLLLSQQRPWPQLWQRSSRRVWDATVHVA